MLMGRIKGTVVKRSSRELLEYNKSKFSADFEQNKKAVRELVPNISKKLANSIAGYISRLIKKEREESD